MSKSGAREWNQPHVNEMDQPTVGQRWPPTWKLGCVIREGKMGFGEGKMQHAPSPPKIKQVVNREEDVSGRRKDV